MLQSSVVVVKIVVSGANILECCEGIYKEHHGQLYVAFSRSGDPNGVKILFLFDKEQGQLYNDGQMYTRNVVYKAVLE